MIDNYLLEYLVLFAETGTIGSVATALGVTQPTVSRGLSKLEKLLNVRLFDRQPQKITLTAAGEFAAQRAATVLQQNRAFTVAVHHFVEKNEYRRIGGTLPGPLLLMKALYQHPGNTQLVIDNEVIPADSLPGVLINHRYSLIFTSRKVIAAGVNSQQIGSENLAIKITKFNPLYHHQTVNFAELNGHEFVVSANIGDWQAVIEQQISHAQFLYQSQATALNELITHSNFPIFKTDLTHYLESFNPVDQKRKYIPITDSTARMPIYANYLKDETDALTPIIDWLSTQFKEIKKER